MYGTSLATMKIWKLGLPQLHISLTPCEETPLLTFPNLNKCPLLLITITLLIVKDPCLRPSCTMSENEELANVVRHSIQKSLHNEQTNNGTNRKPPKSNNG